MSDYRIQGATGEWEVVIGLEVHAQITTNAKLFSGAATEFGAEPNSQVSLIDAAMPGMLPVPNAECIRQAVRTGLVPILNAMIAAGLLSIPGMMTGQILAGGDPQQAARYQLMILLCIAGTVALGTTLAVFLARRAMFDERDRLRLERLNLR